MSERTCRTCAFWEQPGPSDKPAVHGKCRHAEHDEEGRFRWDDFDVEVREEFTPGVRTEAKRLRSLPMLVLDGSGYHAELRTRPEHGCLAWSATLPPQSLAEPGASA